LGSVSRLPAPQSQDFRFQNSTVFRPGMTPISSPVFAGFIPSGGHERGRRVDEDESRARYDREMEELMSPRPGEIETRIQEVQDFYNEAFPEETDHGRGQVSVDYGSHNLPLSSQIQLSPRDQESSGIVPDRFRSGRESLSVLQNVTKRESKRSKGRSLDQDYKRRFSSSGDIYAHSSPVGGNPNPTLSTQKHRDPSPASVHSHHPLRLEPSLRITSGTTQLNEGLENGERRVADCTLPPSTRGIARDDGVARIQGGRSPLLMSDGGGEGFLFEINLTY
jgi:hypothetical protein